MQKISLEQATIRNNSGVCQVREYKLNDKNFDFAIIAISGRYPDQKRMVNTTCSEAVYIAKGSGKVVVEDITYSLQHGDLVLIEKGEKYFWDGNMELHITCRPAFFIEQHKS